VTVVKGMCAGLLLAVGGCWGAAGAHHSPAAFDTAAEVILEGTVAEFSWKNPHVYLTIETVGADGSYIMQEIEGGPASNLLTAGVSATALSVGERVRVRANPNRRGAGRTALGLTVTKADGTVLALRFGERTAPAPESQATSIAGSWLPAAADFATAAGSRLSWPFTETGRAAATDGDALTAVAADCAPFGTPALMVLPTLTSIERAGDRILIDIDGTDTQRIVHLDVEALPPRAERSREGYSIGRWEGETLVVETTAFASDPEGLGFGLPSSPRKRAVERFTLSDDRRRLLYEASVEDPEFLLEPLRLRSTWTYRPDLEPAGLACDLAAARRFLEE
jgi:hypothetical protein